MVLVGKNPPANAGDIRDVGLIPRLGTIQLLQHFSISEIFFIVQCWGKH